MLVIALCVSSSSRESIRLHIHWPASLVASASVHLHVSHRRERSKCRRRRRFLLSFQLDKKFLFTYSFNLSWNTFTGRALLMLLCPLRNSPFHNKSFIILPCWTPIFFRRLFCRGFNFVITRLRRSSLVINSTFRSFVRASFSSILIARSRVFTLPPVNVGCMNF